MNKNIKVSLVQKIKYKFDFLFRLLDKQKTKVAFSKNNKYIERIYIINLDRKTERWANIKKELNRISITNKKKLTNISRRFSATDAKYLKLEDYNNLLTPYYYLSDQFKVEPNPKYVIKNKDKDKKISMSIQEIAVTLSHISVWRKMVQENIPYALILEDDIYFTYGFSNKIDKIWGNINEISNNNEFDILFLSYDYVKGTDKSKIKDRNILQKPNAGIWQASGYVLSKKGVNKLLSLLPVYGPVDLWFNLQFDKLNVFIINEPIIKQRCDIESTNSYSIMPILTQLGLYSDEKPLIFKQAKKLPLIVACGEPNSGLSSLALALSMLGYTCCSDLNRMLNFNCIKKSKKELVFNAFVNVGIPDDKILEMIFKNFPNSKVIFTSKNYHKFFKEIKQPILYLLDNDSDKWKLLSEFLNVDYPIFTYPRINDKGQMKYKLIINGKSNYSINDNYKFDKLPWIISSSKFYGLEINNLDNETTKIESIKWNNKYVWNYKDFFFRDDTFASNLSLFQPSNVDFQNDGNMVLVLKKQKTKVRNYTSAAIATKLKMRYGIFRVELKPSNVSGVITGIFLHRNSPHQEIDIEFLGKDTTGMLINVFYNPGIDGTKLEYGYRGTPVWINLGFDASERFHKYEIKWDMNYISWVVDDIEVYRRNMWQPTPIPTLKMDFNINIWNSISKDLSGGLSEKNLPTYSEIKSIFIEYKKDLFEEQI